MSYNGKRVLVTGGLGFIGSNLAIRLSAEGAHVTVLDACVEGCGANLANLDDAPGEIKVATLNIADAANHPELLQGVAVVFNLAGEIAHTRSMQDPLRDMQLNAEAQLKFLLALHANAPGVRVVFAGTRQVYGVPQYLPVDEAHPIVPVDFNGIHKFAASMYHELLTRQGLLDCVILRLTNVYGPRIALNQPAQGFLGQFFRLALLGEQINIFGDGQQLRDPLYVDDAVDAFLRAGAAETLLRRTYNVGGGQSLRLSEIGQMCAACGGCQVQIQPFPEEHRRIDIGSFAADSRQLRADLAWQPQVPFTEGLRRTLAYFQAHPEPYLSPEDAQRVTHRRPVLLGS